MPCKNKSVAKPDFQDPNTKKAKRIAAIFYLIVMTFVLGGTLWHQHMNKQSAVPNVQKEF